MNARSSVIQTLRGFVQCVYRFVHDRTIVGSNRARSLEMLFTEAEIAAIENGFLGRFSAARPKGTPSVRGVVDKS